MIESIHTPSSPLSKGVLAISAFFAAVALFVAIPLIQAISTGLRDPNKINELNFVIPPPPVLELETPPPPKQEQEQEEIEIDKEPPKLSLDQLEMALNPSTDGIMSGFTVDLSLDAKSLGTDDIIFEIGDVEEKPRPLRQVAPTYPPALKRQKVNGTVNVVFIVDPQGNVIAPRVERSTHPEFEKPALNAIRRWKFSPGKKDGKAVKVRVRAPMIFKVN